MRMTSEGMFWKWFSQQEEKLFRFDSDQEEIREQIFDELSGQLQKVHPDLTFEFGPRDTKREFVISAAGLKRAFPAVAALASSAPVLPRWKIVAFRPRRWPPSTTEFRGKRIHPNDVSFTLLEDGTTAGLSLFLPGYKEDDTDLKMIGYLMLDETLGEHDVETRLAFIEMRSLKSQSSTTGILSPSCRSVSMH
jgi:hypothetical protein